MTTATAIPRNTALLRPILAREHAAWLAEVAAVLGQARLSDAGPWARWHAQRYLETDFPVRVKRERELVRSVTGRLSKAEAAHLWALGELLEVLPQHLGHLAGLCHRSAEFAEVTARISAVLDHWCRAVDEALGPLSVDAVPKEVRMPSRQ